MIAFGELTGGDYVVVVTTVCPPVTTEQWGSGCLAENCSTYDLSRDVDLFWDVLSEYGQIRIGPPPGMGGDQ